MKFFILFSVLALFVSLSSGTEPSAAHTFTINGRPVSESMLRDILDNPFQSNIEIIGENSHDEGIMGVSSVGSAVGSAFGSVIFPSEFPYWQRNYARYDFRRTHFTIDGRPISEFELRRILIGAKEDIRSSDLITTIH